MKYISNTEQMYKIGKDGSVYSLHSNKVLRPYVVKDGVLKVAIKIGGVLKKVTIHKLVASAYIPNPEGKPQIDHIDGDKHNNCVNNLRWCTNEENQEFRVEQGNSGNGSLSKKIMWGGHTYNSIGALAREIAAQRGSKVDTVKKELKAVSYGGKVLYGRYTELVG